MQIAVFDTYVQRPDGRLMHFDIFVANESRNPPAVLEFGRRYLAGKGIPATELTAKECRFCHIESASAQVEREVREAGFSILEMENCD